MKNIDRFGISREELATLTTEALRHGGDWCDLYFQDTVYNDFLLRDSEVSSAGYHIDHGCGIRVLRGEKTGYAYSESTAMQDLMSAARTAGSIAAVPGFRELPPFCTKSLTECGSSAPGSRSFYPVLNDWKSADTSAFAPFLKKIEAGIRARDARAVKVVAQLGWSVSEILMYNSLGELTEDSRPLCSISVQTIFIHEGRTENSAVTRSLRCGAEMLSDDVAEDLISRAVKGMDERFEARRPKGGKMPVVMGAGASGILLHEAMGHAFEADFNRKGQSVFAGKLGQKVCKEGIYIADDGTLPGSRGSINYDDEGVPGQKTYMVADGVLNSYLHDRISAWSYAVAPTGNGRRESFRYNPIPRMRTTYMESGKDGSVSDLIASVKKGIYVDQFSNGQVKIGEGDFTFYVKSGFLIENGRLTMPVKDINIIGNGPQALADIEAVAGDLKIDEGAWTCGKEQSVEVSCGTPSVLVNNLTVGGVK